jgi:prepilin-type N-terminal cleavage/methylation domain-containing protein
MIKNARGMTLTEVLIAVFIITIGLTAVATGMQLATVGINVGQQETTATFLAEEKLEDIKAFALSGSGTQGFANVTSANFPAEAYGTIAINGTSYSRYRRTTTITTPTATTKVIVVNVFYTPGAVSANANAERQVALSTVLTAR